MLNRLSTPVQRAFAAMFIVQTALILFTYGKYFTDPRGYMFMNAFDGLKNYYTLQYYVQHNPAGDYAQFQGMNYPYGDNIFYTDNTPAFAFPLRLMCDVGLPLENAAIPLFHFLLLANLLLASVFAFGIGRRLGLNPWLNALMSIGIVWASPQMFRFFGNMNMALPSVYLGAILLLLVAYERIRRGGRWWPPALGLTGLLVLAAFVHLYHLPILGVMVGSFGALAVFFQKSWPQRLRALALTAVPMAALVITLGFIRLIDQYYALRPIGNGYGLADWRLASDSIFRAYGFLKIPQFARTQGWALEQFAFLGSAVIYGAILAFIFWVISLNWQLKTGQRAAQSEPVARSFVWLLLLVGIISYSTAMGDYVTMFGGNLKYDNWLSPFYFLRFITPQVSQFRCLARFNWGDYYPAWIVVFYALNRLAFSGALPKMARYALLGLAVLLTAVDTANYCRYFHSDSTYENLFQDKHLRALQALDYQRYQAILPLPFFHVGNENADLITDDNGKVSTRAFQISLRSGLPIMACKMSRTPTPMTLAHYSLILEGAEPDKDLLARLNEKPLLVVELKNYEAPANPQKTSEKVIAASKTFVQRYNLQKVGEDADCNYYEWAPPGR